MKKLLSLLAPAGYALLPVTVVFALFYLMHVCATDQREGWLPIIAIIVSFSVIGGLIALDRRRNPHLYKTNKRK